MARGMIVAGLAFAIAGCCSTQPMIRAVMIDRPEASKGRLAVQVDWAKRGFLSTFVHPDTLLLKDAVERYPCERAEFSGESLLMIFDHDFDKFVGQMEAARRAAGRHVGERRSVQILGQDVLAVDWDSLAYLASIDGKALCWAKTEAEMGRLISSAREYLADDSKRKEELRSGLHFEFVIGGLRPFRRSALVERLNRIAPLSAGYARVLRHADSLTLRQWYSADLSNEYTRVVVKMDSERWKRQVEEAWVSAKREAHASSSQPRRTHFLDSLSVTSHDNQVELFWSYPNAKSSIMSQMFDAFVVASEKDEAKKK